MRKEKNKFSDKTGGRSPRNQLSPQYSPRRAGLARYGKLGGWRTTVNLIRTTKTRCFWEKKSHKELLWRSLKRQSPCLQKSWGSALTTDPETAPGPGPSQWQLEWLFEPGGARRTRAAPADASGAGKVSLRRPLGGLGQTGTFATPSTAGSHPSSDLAKAVLSSNATRKKTGLAARRKRRKTQQRSADVTSASSLKPGGALGNCNLSRAEQPQAERFWFTPQWLRRRLGGLGVCSPWGMEAKRGPEHKAEVRTSPADGANLGWGRWCWHS